MNNPSPQTLDAAWKLIDDAGSIVVAMHHNPDGDALGSAIALTMALQEMGRPVQLVSPQRMPEIYDFLEWHKVLDPRVPSDPPDLAILVDCDRPERTGALSTTAAGAAHGLVLDHHPPTGDYGDVRVTQQDCAATAEVIFYLLRHRNRPISQDMARALLTAIITDTGGFRYPNTRPETLDIAGHLTRYGVSTAEIAERVYETRSYSGLKLLAHALTSLQVSPNGTVSWAKLSSSDFEETGAKPEDTEGFVNMVHALKGADVAVILREEKPGHVRVSLRSRGETPVNKAAEELGGGGHELAAACVLEDSLEDAEQRVLEELRKWTVF